MIDDTQGKEQYAEPKSESKDGTEQKKKATPPPRRNKEGRERTMTERKRKKGNLGFSSPESVVRKTAVQVSMSKQRGYLGMAM